MAKKSSKLFSHLTGIQRFLSFGIIGILIIFISLFSALYIIQYKPSIAFYNVPEASLKAITDSVQSSNNKEYRVIVLDPSIPLSSQTKKFKKASYLFVTEDFDTLNFIKTSSKVKPVSVSFLTGYCSTFVADTAAKSSVPLELPLLYDFYQLDINFEAFSNTDLSTITFWNDLKKYLNEEKNLFLSPFLFAGGDDIQLINLVGSLTEALSSSRNLKSAEEEIYQAYTQGKLDAVLDKLTMPDGALYPALAEIRSMISDGLIHSSTLNLPLQDFQFQLNNKMCAAAFLRLSDHRQISRDTIENYTSIYCPEIAGKVSTRDADRWFSAPKIAAVKLKSSRRADNVLVRLSDTNQTELCSYSGLAPVQRECQTPDHQSDDVRYWLAASKGPVMPLAASLPDEKARTETAAFIRNFLLK